MYGDNIATSVTGKAVGLQLFGREGRREGITDGICGQSQVKVRINGAFHEIYRQAALVGPRGQGRGETVHKPRRGDGGSDDGNGDRCACRNIFDGGVGDGLLYRPYGQHLIVQGGSEPGQKP